MSKPKVLLFDLESIGVNALRSDLGIVACFGYKWLGDKRARCLTIDERSLRRFSDKKLLQEASKIMQEADLLIGHFSSVFDRRFFQGRLLINGLPPIPRTNMRDTCFMARAIANFSSNRLKHLATVLGLKNQKMDKGRGSVCEWPASWFKVMQGDMKALRGMATYCFTPNHKLLGQDLRWKSADSYKQGDVVLGFDEHGPHRRFRSSIIEAISFADEDTYEVTLASGKTFRTTAEHKWLLGKRRGKASKPYWRLGKLREPKGHVFNFGWVETKDLVYGPESSHCAIPLLDVWEQDMSNEAGWLAGVFDGEGCLTRNGGRIAIAQNPGPVLDRICHNLDKYAPGRSNRQTKAGSKCQSIHLRGPLCEQLKFLGTVRPERLISKIDFDKLGRLESRNGVDDIVSVIPVGVQTIIKIQTSTGTLVVDGYPMHNCKQDVETLEELYNKLKPFDQRHERLYTDRTKCGVCGGDVQYRGTAINGERRYRRFQCTKCSKWGRDTNCIKEGKGAK